MNILLEIVSNDLHVFLRTIGPWKQAPMKERVVTLVLGGLFALFLLPTCIFSGLWLGSKGVDSISYLRLMFTYVFLLVMILTMSFSTSILVTNYDLPLLLSSPVRGKTLVLARYLSVWSLFGLLLFPLFALFMVSFSIAAASLWSLLLGIVAFLLMYSTGVMLGVLCSLVITALMTRATSSKRALKPFVVISLLAIIFIFYRLLIVSSEFSLGEESGKLYLVPVSYGADLIFLESGGLVLIAFSLVVMGLGLVLLRSYALRFWRLREGAPSSKAKGSATYKEITTSIPLSVEAIMSKEAKHLLREPDTIVRLFILAALFISIPIAPVFTVSTIEPRWMVFLIFAMAWASTMVLCANSLGIEGRRLNLLRLSPLQGRQFMLGKWLLASILTLMFTLALTLSMAAVSRISLETFLFYLLFCIIVSATGSAMGVGVGAFLPDFKRGAKNRPGMNAFMLLSLLFLLSFTPAMVVMASQEITWVFDTHYKAIFVSMAISSFIATVIGLLALNTGAKCFDRMEATDIR